MQPARLFHISEDPDIEVFSPRPSPSWFEQINGEVVFAISDQLLHNYLLPRDCPRVSFYAGPQSTLADIEKFIGQSPTKFVMALETKWLPLIQQATIYCYELPTPAFTLLDAGAGYYISYEAVKPLSVTPLNNLLAELSKRNVALRFVDTLKPLAAAVSQSTLHFSNIRMRNAE